MVSYMDVLESQMEGIYQQSMKHKVSAISHQTNQYKLPHKILQAKIITIGYILLIYSG